MTRLYGRAQKNQRINDYVPDVRFKRVSIVSTIRLSGEQAPFVFSGGLTSDIFSVYVKEILSPTLKAGDIVVMDNLPSHKVFGVLEPIYQQGAIVLFLPPYSPDLNPIELSWSKMKAILKTLKPRTQQELEVSLQIALNSFSNRDILNWFAYCGYRVNE